MSLRAGRSWEARREPVQRAAGRPHCPELQARAQPPPSEARPHWRAELSASQLATLPQPALAAAAAACSLPPLTCRRSLASPPPIAHRSHLLSRPGAGWEGVPDLPKAAKAALDAGFALFTTKLLVVQRSADGGTTKLLVALQDGLQVESVVMEYDNTGG